MLLLLSTFRFRFTGIFFQSYPVGCGVFIMFTLTDDRVGELTEQLNAHKGKSYFIHFVFKRTILGCCHN